MSPPVDISGCAHYTIPRPMTSRAAFVLSAFLACLSSPRLAGGGSLDADSAESSVLFDGAAESRAKAVAPSPAGADRERLEAEFRKQIVIDDHGDPAERKALDSMISRLLESASARELAAKFIKEDAKIELSFEDIPGSVVATVEGRKTIWGTRGFTETTKNPPRVVLNKFFMQYERDFGVGTLAHETLGHAFEAQRAGGDLGGIYLFNTDEEESARLVGWLVRTELEVKPEAEIWNYLQSPEENRESLKMGSVYYALTLTSAEMKDPVPAYEKRISDADKALAQLNGRTENYEGWNRIVDHLVNKHKMDAASFQSRRDDIANALKAIPAGKERLSDIKAALRGRLAYFSTGEGKLYLDRLAKEADNDYFRQKDAVILERRERLSGLLLGTAPDTSPPPPLAGQITWQQLSELAKKDKDSCPFGGLK